MYNTLDLLTTGEIPDDCEVLILTSPSRVDYTADERDMIIEYLTNEGRALVVMDPVLGFEQIFPNVNRVLAEYGVMMEFMLAIEADTRFVFPMDPRIFRPQLFRHDITTGIIESELPPIIARPQNVQILDIRRNNVNVERVMTTTASAYGKINPEAASIFREEDDADGPFNIAVAITENMWANNRNYTTKLVVSGAGTLLDSDLNEVARGANFHFVTTALEWLADVRTVSTYIAPKDFTFRQARLTMTASQANMVKVFTMGVLPLAIFAAGLGMWLYRRHK